MGSIQLADRYLNTLSELARFHFRLPSTSNYLSFANLERLEDWECTEKESVLHAIIDHVGGVEPRKNIRSLLTDEIRNLERRLEEQKMAEELLKESENLNKMTMEIVKSPQQDKAETGMKRNLADYSELEEKAEKFLAMCKKLKATERR